MSHHFVDSFAELLERERLTRWLVPESTPDLGLPLRAEPAFIILELEVLGQRSYEFARKLRSLLFGQLGRDLECFGKAGRGHALIMRAGRHLVEERMAELLEGSATSRSTSKAHADAR